MDKKIEALKLALEALERIDLWLKARYSGIGLVNSELEAITAIREALAEQFCDNHCTWLDHHPECDKAMLKEKNK